MAFILFSVIDFVRDKAKDKKKDIYRDVDEKNRNDVIENDLDSIFSGNEETFLETEKGVSFETDRENSSKVDDMYETVLLQEDCYVEQRILVGKIKGKQRQIDLSTFPFIIGKSKEQADYVIDDPSISRIHARFTLRDGIVFLTDLNSTNGSMKNGIRLQPNELVELEAEDEIKFGRVTFTYH